MGRLLGLELHNFKSYKGTIELGFGESNFTSIIGPNGSGKSNMMDAISFVLGIRSQHLRSNALKDLIYRGIRTDDEPREALDAHVKAFYKKSDGSVIELMRYIATNGETTYKLNGETVTYKQYSSFLESESILINAKNFLVFQGDVEQIASQSSNDLSKLFEEVSGSIQFKKEYDHLKEEIEKVSQSVTDSVKTRRRIHGELKTYKEGVVRDEHYQKYLERKKQVQNYKVLWQLYHIEKKRREFIQQLEASKALLQESKNELKLKEKVVTDLKKAFTKENALLAKEKTNHEFKMKDKEKIIASLKIIKVPQRSANKRINNLEKRIDNLKHDLERQSENVKRFENQFKVLCKSKKLLVNEIKENERNDSKYNITEENLALYEQLKEKFLSSGGSKLNEEISVLENHRQELIEEVQIIQRRMDLAHERISDDLELTRDRISKQITDFSSILNDKNSLHSLKVKELRDLQLASESARKREYDLNCKLREVLLKIDELSATQRETNKEKKLRENVAALKRFFPGVRGVVHDLCQPKKEKYSIAVSTVLGRNFNAIVVDSLAVAQECIAYLKKQRAGTATFIPLDTIESETPSLAVPESQEYLLAINAVEFESEFRGVMQYACSDAIICNSLDIARDLKWKKGVKSKLVTLDGALIHKAGLMSGGAQKTSNNRWSKEEYQSLITLKDQLMQQIEELAISNKDYSIEMREIENSISIVNNEISTIRIKLTQSNRVLEENIMETEYHEGIIKKEFEPKLSDLRTRIDKLDASIIALEKHKSSLQEEIFKTFSERLGFSVLEYERNSAEISRKQNKELQELQKQILNVENKLQFETDRLKVTENSMMKLSKSLDEAQLELENLERKAEEDSGRLEHIESEIIEQEDKIKNLQEVLNSKQNQLESLEEIQEELSTKYQSLKDRIEILKEQIDKMDVDRLSHLKNCKLFGIDISTKSEVSIDALPVTAVDPNAISISNDIEIDYEHLPQPYKEDDTDQVVKELDDEIKDIDSKLEELQPDARAADRYDEAQDKFEAIDQETEDLKSQEKKVLTRFMKIKRKRKELFMSAFDHVNEHLDPIYRELTSDPNSHAALSGGNASLTLEEEDEPFNGGVRYHATPPLKRFKDMEYLSGGEKTIAALALLFAINSFHPSPFFVLDEIDAALDITNVERIAAYIRRHGNGSLQFIVISLKNTMFEKSDALVGVYRQQELNASQVVTLDLSQYTD